MSTTQTDRAAYATQIPSATAVIPVQPAHQALAVVATPKPPKRHLTFTQVRDFIASTDMDGSRSEHGNRTWATLNNGISSMLATGHCIPGLSAACAPASIAFGAIKIVGGFLGLVEGHAGVSRGLWISGAKSIGLGLSVFFLPGVSEALSIVVAAKDGADALNAAVDRPGQT